MFYKDIEEINMRWITELELSIQNQPSKNFMYIYLSFSYKKHKSLILF